MTATTNAQLLIVDDEPINIEILVDVFDDDYDIIVAVDGAQAIDLAHSAHPDLILLDVMMPGMNGYEVCTRLKQDPATREIPVIFVTGLGEERAEAQGLDVGAVDYVTKPISQGIVRRRVANHIELKKARDRLAQLAVTLERKNEELLLLYKNNMDDLAVANNIASHIMRSDGLRDPKISYFQRPAQQFSGDFIAAARDGNGDLRVMLADVTGHGLQAALFLLPIFRTFHTMVKNGLTTGDIVAEMNQIMREISVAERFIAAVVAHIKSSSVELWNGGISTVFYVQSNGEFHKFYSRHLPLGVVGADTFETTTEIFHTQPGALLLCSDGLTEAEDVSGKQFGEDSLETILRTSPLAELFDNILAALKAHLGESVAHDDLSILLAKCGY
ncbi:two-component system, HptB-dependent secretion and biofilm response regulator [Gammaproteobacteria bacterium]